MSIINQMMKDLEKRKISPLAGYNSAPPSLIAKKSSIFVMGGFLGLIPLSIAFFNINADSVVEPALPSLADIINHNLEAFPTGAGMPIEASLIATNIKPIQITSQPTIVNATQPQPEAEPSPQATIPERIIYAVKPGDSLSKIFANLELSAKQLHYVTHSGPHAKQLTQLQPGQAIHFLFSESGDLQQLFFEKTRKNPALNIFRAANKEYIATIVSPHYLESEQKKTADKNEQLSHNNGEKKTVSSPKQATQKITTTPDKDQQVSTQHAPNVISLNTPSTTTNIKTKATTPSKYNLALNAMKLHQPNTAILHLQNALISDPKELKSRVLLASLLQKTGYPRKVTTVLEAGLQYPHNASLIQPLAQHYLSLQTPSKAIALLQDSIKKEPNDALSALLAACYQRTEQHQAAINQYQSSLKTQPNQPKLWVGIGISLEATKQHKKAENAYQKALNLGLTPQLKNYTMQRLQYISRS
ncbi:MAG: hypothetical protein HOM11_08005 [Methylococcales bacterium]|jgi:Tfp pilus assembly protein PilF|nr:hypothetical protein [Methylococcales bacterium]MBT7442697.1 hypothetical protein [Methylococcales bacterium]